MKNVYKILIEKPEGKRPARHRWEENTEMDFRETGFWGFLLRRGTTGGLL
jgi:hypothetical protein